MSTDRETTLAVRSWLEAGVTRLPDRVLDAVLDQVPTTPQRRSGWSAWRTSSMSMYAKLAAAAAAVLVVAVVGYQLLPGQSGPGAPSAVPSPTATPAPTLIPSLPTQGSIDPGTYRMGVGPWIEITIPAGWVSIDGGSTIEKHPEEPGDVALSIFSADLRVFTDACQSADTDEPVGPTVDDLLAALHAQKNSRIGEPVAVTVGGLPGSRLEISAPAGLDLTRCTVQSLQIWQGAWGGWLAGIGAGEPPQVARPYVADTRAGRLAFYTDVQPQATTADVAELEAIIASITIAE